MSNSAFQSSGGGGSISRNGVETIGDNAVVTYTHNLGVIPSRIFFEHVNTSGSGSGFYDSSGQSAVSMDTGPHAYNSNGAAMLPSITSGLSPKTGVVSNVTTTTFDVTWSSANLITGNFIWLAES